MEQENRQLIEAALKATKAQKETLKSLREECIAEYGGVAVWIVDVLGFCESIEVFLQALLEGEDVSTVCTTGEPFCVDQALDFVLSFYDGEELAFDLAIR